MKKFGKFLFTTLSLAAIAGGAFYLIKKVVKKDTEEDFDDFEDDFDDFDSDEEEEETGDNAENREYVTIHLDSNEEKEDADVSSDQESVSEDTKEDSME